MEGFPKQGGKQPPGPGTPKSAQSPTANPPEQLDQPTVSGCLLEAIENRIIPRLLELHAQPTATQWVAQRIDAFVNFAKAGNQAACAHIVREGLDQGHSLSELYLNLLSPSAQRLGEEWESDQSSFVEVTLGLAQLQQLVLDLSPMFQSRRVPGCVDQERRMLLCSMPGNMHTFGMGLLAEFLREAGWNVEVFLPGSIEELSRRVQTQTYDAIGISAGATVQLHHVREALAEVRAVSRNPHLVAIVGGPIFAMEPHWASEVGADGTAPDARQAVELADRLWRARQRPASSSK
jgi:methanogenic corrinoid protein MtbC1